MKFRSNVQRTQIAIAEITHFNASEVRAYTIDVRTQAATAGG